MTSTVYEESEREWLEIPFKVEAAFAGYRLDRFLKARIRRMSRTRIQQIIIKGQVRREHADEPLLRAATRLRAGDGLVVRRPMPIEPPVVLDYREVYRDPWLLVLDKPAGLPVHPSTRYHKHTLTSLMTQRLGEGHGWEMAHRLDRETSGLLVFGRARTIRGRRVPPSSAGVLKRSFQRREVHKEYLALCHGVLASSMVVDAPMGPHPASQIKLKMGIVSVEDGGLEAHTQFEPLGSGVFLGEPITLVRARPRTGRQHQIRVHLDHIGYPIVGDKLYGVEEELFVDLVEGRRSMVDVGAQLGISRHALHAHKIVLPHPNSGETVTFQAPWPQNLAQVLALPSLSV